MEVTLSNLLLSTIEMDYSITTEGYNILLLDSCFAIKIKQDGGDTRVVRIKQEGIITFSRYGVIHFDS